MTLVNKHVTGTYMLDKVLPTIKKNCHEKIQTCKYLFNKTMQEHITSDDGEFCQLASQESFDIHLMCQLTNSPNLNILHLGFIVLFNPYNKQEPNSADELVSAIDRSFEAIFPIKSNSIFLTFFLGTKDDYIFNFTIVYD